MAQERARAIFGRVRFAVAAQPQLRREGMSGATTPQSLFGCLRLQVCLLQSKRGNSAAMLAVRAIESECTVMHMAVRT